MLKRLFGGTSRAERASSPETPTLALGVDSTSLTQFENAVTQVQKRIQTHFSTAEPPGEPGEPGEPLEPVQPLTPVQLTVPLKPAATLASTNNVVKTNILQASEAGDVKQVVANKLAQLLVNDDALTLVLALCKTPVYSQICAKSDLGTLLCMSLGVIMDCTSVVIATQASTRASHVLEGLIQTEEGQNNVLHYVDTLISLAVDDRGMTSSQVPSAAQSVSTAARNIFFALAKRGYLSQSLHEDMNDKRFLSMLLHKSQASMERQCKDNLFYVSSSSSYLFLNIYMLFLVKYL